MRQNQSGVAHIALILLLLAGIITGVYLVQKEQVFKSRAYQTAAPTDSSPLYDEYSKPVERDINKLGLFGQKKITESSRNTVSGKKVYHASGVIVDRSSTPNKIYVVDSGNNRILGFNGYEENKDPELVFGQPDLFSASCNHDNNLGIFKKPSPDTLCLVGFPIITNVAEYWMRSNIDVDSEGNLYVPDVWNNRILKYNQPFSEDKSDGKGDTIADFVLGQSDLFTNSINGGSYTEDTISSPNEKTIYINSGEPDIVSSRGVSVDPEGNIWVADTFNHRVLRFPKASSEADLVIGQNSFNERYRSCRDNAPLNKLCSPTLAKINPETGELFVLDEHPRPFIARILVFKAPFEQGMSADRIIIPNQPGPFYNWPEGVDNTKKYIFQSTGFSFNQYKEDEYAQGLLWINEHDTFRTILIDNQGTILKVIGAPGAYQRGGDSVYPQECGSIYEGYNLWAPGGSIGFDSENNIYLADERFHRISRYKLPYDPIEGINTFCLPTANGGLFPGITANTYDDQSKLGESVGMTVFENQLIAVDESKLKVWENYSANSIGQKPDFIISERIPARLLITHAIDDQNRLWLLNAGEKLRIYQLPLTPDSKPIVDNVRLYWADNGEELRYNFIETSGIAFDKKNKAIYIADRRYHRILRIKNYTDIQDKLLVDMVIGQTGKHENKCNQTQQMPWLAGGAPRADTLCNPYQLSFDNNGNLFVIENSYECHGNTRITVFMAEDLQNTEGLFPEIEAKKVFVSNSLDQKARCKPHQLDRWSSNEPESPVSLAFNSKGQMVVGNDGYFGDLAKRATRQLWFYNDPLNKQTPDGYINLPMGSAGEITFDKDDNLLIQDHTWNRIWLINLQTDPGWLVKF